MAAFTGMTGTIAKKEASFLSNPDEPLLHYVEEFGLFFEQFGLPRTAGRMMSWLLVCDPPHQTMDELVEVLQVSKSSVSTTSRMLIQSGLVDKVSFPGERKDFYRINDDAWIKAWQARNTQAIVLRQLAERGLNLLPEEKPDRRVRLQMMRDLYQFLEDELPKLTDRWLKERAQQTQ
jgi:DNA-binding transcriptional regulator GbsR (MarR family)